MLSPILFDFLLDLKENNNREWFDANRQRYENAKNELLGFIENLLPEVAAFEPSIYGIDPKKTLFRIYRDTRFSKDKTPYKTNMGVHITPGGKQSPLAGYYLHLEPGSCFLGGGSYMPMPEILQKIRTYTAQYGADLEEIVQQPAFKEVFGALQGEKLKSIPKGFDKEHPYGEFLKMKSMYVGKEFSQEKCHQYDFLSYVKEGFQTMQPLNLFLNRAIQA